LVCRDDPEGVAFEYDVLDVKEAANLGPVKPTSIRLRIRNGRARNESYAGFRFSAPTALRK
jgi:hypothetical protein